MTGRALPAVDRDSEPFWTSLRAHQLTVQQCDACHALRFPPRAVCDRCHADRFRWMACPGRGRVLSWAVTHQRFHPAFDVTPYTVLLVELDEQPGLAMYGDLIGDPTELAVGAPVVAEFEDVTETVTVVHWRPA